MTLATIEAPLRGEAPTRAACAPRFVQLPTDLDAPADDVPAFPVSTWLREARRERLLAALVALLHRYSQQQNIAVDVFSSTSNRTQPVAMDFEVMGDMSIGTLVDCAHALMRDETARATLEPSTQANVAVAFALIPSDAESAYSAGATVATLSVHEVYFIFAQTDRGTLLLVRSNSRSIQAASIRRWLDCLTVLLGALAADESIPVERLPLLSSSALAALTDVEVGPASHSRVPLICAFEAIARQQPRTLAVAYQDQCLTYGELDELSNQLAHRLCACGVSAGTAVAVCLSPSCNVLVAILAIWKVRGIYLPLDPGHPVALIARMLEESQPRLVLTVTKLSELTRQFPQFIFDCEADRELLESESRLPLVPEPNLADPAYLIYTSGTTGKSKGVLATQANLAYYVRSAIQRYRFNSEDTFVSLARYTFSISIFELITPICCGASLRVLDRDEVLTPSSLCHTLDRVTVVHAGPSLLTNLFRYLQASSPERTFPGIRHASSGGDIVSPKLMEEMKRVFPNAEIFVIYGCTEISCMGTTFPVLRNLTPTRSFVGKPFPNTILRVLDARRELLPWGVVGEIYFSGEGVVPGYFERPELTVERFVEIGGRRYYQTGDMGRLHPDGNLEILGRRDNQVQVRGIRVELLGIERVIQELQLAAQCAVVARTMDDGELRLIAFLVKPRGPDTLASLRRTLASELPDYMLPHHVVALDAMPLTINGKLDRGRLKELPFDAPAPESGNVHSTQATDRERSIAEVFARVLGRSSVGVDQDFFDLGGDSLLGVIALDQLSRTLGISVPPHVLFDGGTARAIALHARGNGSALHDSKPVLLNQSAAHPPVFLLSGMHIYRELARRFEGEWAAYGVFAAREFSAYAQSDLGEHSVEALAAEYLALVRSSQAHGPYRLVGYSFAGLVAFELAQMLRAQGEEVRFLAMLDATLPEWSMGWRWRMSQIARIRSAPTRDVASFMLRRARERLLRLEDVEFIRHKEDGQLAPLEERRNAFNRIASERYIPHILPYAGNVTLIVSGHRLRRDPLKSPDCGWGPYVRELDLHTIDADHFAMLTDEPHVTKVAEVLTTGLRRADLGHLQASATSTGPSNVSMFRTLP